MNIPGFNLMDMMTGIFGSESIISKVKGMIEVQLGKFAEKMKPEDCLFSVPSSDGKKLLTFKGTFKLNPDKTFTVVATGKIDIGEVISKLDPSKLTEQQTASIQKQLTDGSTKL